MIIVKFNSGIGNQLYQYVIYSLVKRLYPNQTVKGDVSSFEDDLVLNNGNGFSYGFALNSFFGKNIPIASKSEIKSVTTEFIFSSSFRRCFPGLVKKMVGNSLFSKLRVKIMPRYRRLDEGNISNKPFDSFNGGIYLLDESKNYYLNGLWQNYEYIRPIEDELRRELQLKVELSPIAEKIKNDIDCVESVCLHVRRGNFTTPENRFSHDLCDESYYASAIDMVKKKVSDPFFFVFSDDIEYCKSIFSNIENVIYVSGTDGLTTEMEMYLISRCKSAIIPNSTFAFWSVWLSDRPDKIVIAPKYSVRDRFCWHLFSLPSHWIVIDNVKKEISCT